MSPRRTEKKKEHDKKIADRRKLKRTFFIKTENGKEQFYAKELQCAKEITESIDRLKTDSSQGKLDTNAVSDLYTKRPRYFKRK